MKKRIVAFALALVMTVLALVGCGAPSIDEIELKEYASFDIDDFIKALGEIEIDDGAFTNNSKDRETAVLESIYSKIVTNLMKTDDELFKGTIGANDVVYYSYYIEDAEGNIYYEAPKGSGYTAIMKNEYNIQFGMISEKDDTYELDSKIKDVLVGKDITDKVYEVVKKENTAITVGEGETVTIVVSYTRTHIDDGGTPGDDEEAKKDDKTITEKAYYDVLVLSKDSADPLVKLLLNGNEEIGEAALKIIDSGNKNVVTFTKEITNDNGTPDDTSDDKKETKSTNKFKVTEDGVEYEYSNMKILWSVEKAGADEFTFTHTPFVTEGETDDEKEKSKVKLYPIGVALDSKDSQVDLTDKELTYHIFPVSYYDIPEFENDSALATAILEYYLGDSLKADSFKVLADKLFGKKDDKGDADATNDTFTEIKTYVAQLIEIYAAKKDSKKWATVSEALAKEGAIAVLKKLASGNYVLTDDEKDATKSPLADYYSMFDLLASIADLALADKLNSSNVEVNNTGKKDDATITADERAKLEAAYATLKTIVDENKFDFFYKASYPIFVNLETSKAITAAMDAAKEALGLYEKYTEVFANRAAIVAKKAEIAAIEAKGDAATDDEKASLDTLKTDVADLEKKIKDNFPSTEIIKFKTASLKVISTLKSTAMEEAVAYAIDNKIAEIVSAKNDKATEDTADDVIAATEIAKELKESIYETEDEKYRDYIQQEVSKAVYQLIIDKVKIKTDKNGQKLLPEDLVEEFKKHIYEQNEHKFFTGTRSGAKNEDGTPMSNYKYFKGDLEAFLKDAYKDKYTDKYQAEDYLGKMTEEARGYIEPMIKIYTVAAAFNEKGAQKELAKFLEADIKAGIYNSYYKNNDKLSAEENAEAKAKAEEQSKEYIEFLREYSQFFIIDDDAFDLYVDFNFGSAYDDYEEMYGERNLRMAEQLNKLMDYLVGVKGTVVKHNDNWEFKHTMGEDVRDGVTYYTMSFHNSLIKYTVK